jgi:hypothetical protein
MEDSNHATDLGVDYVFAATTGRAGSHRLAAALDACEGVHATHEAEPSMDGRLMRWALSGQFPADFLAQRFTMSIRSSRERSRLPIRADISKVFIKWYGEHVLERLGPERCLVIRLWREPIEVMRRLLVDGAVPGAAWGDAWSTHWMGDPEWDGCRLRVELRSAEEAVAWHVVETIVRGEALAEMRQLRITDLDFETIADPDALAGWLSGQGFRPSDGFAAQVEAVPADRALRSGAARPVDERALLESWRRIVGVAADRGLLEADLAAALEARPDSFGRSRRTDAA